MRVLALLGADDGGAVTVAVPREHGIQAPVRAVYELQLAGYDIELAAACKNASGRQALGYRLRDSAATSPVHRHTA